MINRRQFMRRIGQICAGIGSLFATRQSGASEGKLTEDMLVDAVNKMEVYNGQVYQAPWPFCHIVIVMYLGRGDEWVLLYGPYKAAQHGGTAVCVCYYERKDGKYNPIYTKRELQEKLKDWTLLERELRLEDKYMKTKICTK